MSFEWNDETIAEASCGWIAGVTAQVIANRLNKMTGATLPGQKVTRNAVIGKVYRLGLPKRKSGENPIKMSQVKAEREKRKRKPAEPKSFAPPKQSRFGLFLMHASERKLPMPPAAPTDVARLAFADLKPHHCRFPVGHPGETNFGFCGASKVDGLPYCEHHAKRCYEPVRASKHLRMLERRGQATFVKSYVLQEA